MDRVDELGFAAWDEFYNQMERRYNVTRGRSQYWSHKYYKTFRKIAEMCMRHSFDVVDFIMVSFDVVYKEYRYITPKDFSAKPALDRYQRHSQIVKSQPRADWTMQVASITDYEARLIPKMYQSEEDILLSFHMPFTAWFRVLYPDYPSDEIYRYYAQTAWSELQADIRLRRFIREQMPHKLEELEKRIGRFQESMVEGISQ